jgi:hypothetical protein
MDRLFYIALMVLFFKERAGQTSLPLQSLPSLFDGFELSPGTCIFRLRRDVANTDAARDSKREEGKDTERNLLHIKYYVAFAAWKCLCFGMCVCATVQLRVCVYTANNMQSKY